MKKFTFLIAFSLIFSPMLANAETIYVVDQNNIVRQQIYTQPMYTQPQTVYTQPQQVYVQQPVVVRQQAPRTYYYDSIATGMLVGLTGIAIGSAIFGHHHHHHGGRPAPHHHGGHHGGHHRR